MDLKKLVEECDYAIVLDTNVLLNIYRYSPEFTEFAMNCLLTVKQEIILPATVRMEFKRNHKSEFYNMQKRVEMASREAAKRIDAAKVKVLASCDNLQRLQFPDVDELRTRLSDKFDEAKREIDDFFTDRGSLNMISHAWAGADRVLELVNDLDKAFAVLPSPTQDELYEWCDDGEIRYKNNVPPGFKDSKNKDGVRKYSDLIIWKEIIRYAKANTKNVIFVTDDVKADWWEEVDGKRQFHSKLKEEFGKTGRDLLAYSSNEFYEDISNSYDVPKTDAVDIALRMTDADYYKKVEERVYDFIEHELIYSNATYIDTSSAHIGTEGIDEFDIVEHEFISAERVDRSNEVITYRFKYRIVLEGTSYEYWGRDEDTREVIRSYGTDHVFEGIITVEVLREADIFLDFEQDNDFTSASIIDGLLEETSYSENWEEMVPGELGYCPDCGCALEIENDGGNGFCVKCAPNH